MWPALVLGILTAIFAWIWYRGGGEATDPETVALTAETEQECEESEHGPLAAHLASRQSSLPAEEPDSRGQELPCLRSQENKAVNPETYQARKEESRLQGREGLADGHHLESGLEVQRLAATNVPSLADQQSSAPTPELWGKIQEHPSDVPKEEEPHGNLKEDPSDLPKKEELQADLQEHPTDVLKKEELQADLQEHPTDVLKKEELQADLQEHPTDVLKKEELQADLQEHPTDVLKKEELQADIQDPTTDVQKKEEPHGNLKEHPSDCPKKEKLQADIQDPTTDVLKKGHLQADIDDPTTDALKKEEPHGNIKEHPTDLSIKEELQAELQDPTTNGLNKEKPHVYIKEHPTDVLKKVELQADIQEHPTDVSKKAELQARIQEHPTDVSKKDEQVLTLEHQAVFPVKGDILLEEHVKDLVQTSANESSKNDEVHSREVELHPSEIPEARQIIISKEVYIPLENEVQLEEGYPEDNLGKAVVQATGEVLCPTLMAEEPGAQELLADSCHARMSAQGEEVLRLENDSLDGVCAAREVNAANQATGYPLENSFVVQENAMNLCKAKETLNQDLYLEMVNTLSEDGNATIADQFMKQSVEKCDLRMPLCSDIVKPPTGFLDDADLLAGSLKESPQQGLAKVQKLETLSESSSVDIYNLGFNPEKEMAFLSSSNTDEKTSFDSLLEANIHEIDHQKTRKVATIQPMPQNVNFILKVHYITHNDSQIIAITGDHEKLGKWDTYVPLTSGNGGFWSHSVTLPADSSLAWKFVMVENGKIKRWEECNNRFLKTAHEDIEAQLWWGYP